MNCGVCNKPLKTLHSVCDCGKDLFVDIVLKDEYRLLGKVAEGGMGILYRAISLKDEELYAIKISRWIKPLQELRHIKEEEARQEEEARVKREFTLLKTAASQSQHIVQVYGDYHYDERIGLYYPMEFLEGVLLSAHPKYIERFSPSKVITLMLQLCEALGVAHALGVVHRDLNPDNVFIVRGANGKDFVKLIDFGIARDLYDRRKLFDTGDNLGFGHLHYLSPEQVGYSAKEKRYTKASSAQLDHRADIFSLGAIMCHMLIGKPPYRTGSFEDLAFRKWDEPENLNRAIVNEEIPQNIQEILLFCLKPDPQERLGDLYALTDMLEHAQRQLQGIPESNVSAFTLDLTGELGILPEGLTFADSFHDEFTAALNELEEDVEHFIDNITAEVPKIKKKMPPPLPPKKLPPPIPPEAQKTSEQKLSHTEIEKLSPPPKIVSQPSQELEDSSELSKKAQKSSSKGRGLRGLWKKI